MTASTRPSGLARTRRRGPMSVPRGARASRAVVVVVAVVVAAAVAAGVVTRVWYVGHEPIDADEAVAGLMARHILAGHANAFFWGQRYGGVEPYLVAAVFWVAGPSVVALRLTPVLLDAVACLLLFLLARHLVARRELAALAAAAMWAAPQSAVWNSTLEYGFRGVTMVSGLAMLVLTWRAVERDRPGWELAGAGAAAGVGWWSSPEIVYFAIPGGLWLLRWAWVQRRAIRARAARALSWAVAAVAAAGAGALPWLWDNVTTGFPSLNTASYHVPANSPGYEGRLAVFFKDAFPMALDLRTPGSGAWSVPVPLALAIYAALAAAIVAAALWCVARRSAGGALAVAVAAFPFLFALIPGSWLWESGRYVNFLVPLVLLLVVVAADGALAAGRLSTHVAAARRSGRVALAAALVAAGVVALSTVTFTRLQTALVPAGVRLGQGGPDAPARALAAALERRGVTEGYADYWIAYKVDFLSGGRLRIVPSPPSPDRTPALTARVAAAPARDEAWLFMAPSRFEEVEYHTWGSPVLRGPGGLPEASFLGDLARLGVRYRVLRVGDVDVVYPSRRISFAEVGLRPFAR